MALCFAPSTAKSDYYVGFYKNMPSSWIPSKPFVRRWWHTYPKKTCIKATLVKIGANQRNSNTFAFKSRINFRQIMCHFKYYLAGCRIFCKATLEKRNKDSVKNKKSRPYTATFVLDVLVKRWLLWKQSRDDIVRTTRSTLSKSMYYKELNSWNISCVLLPLFHSLQLKYKLISL